MKGESIGVYYWRRLKRNPLAMLGLGLILFFTLMALLAPVISPWDPQKINLEEILSPPSLKHPFGTDSLGRDLLSRVIWGSRISLSVGFVAVGISVIIGTIWGLVSGYAGGKMDNFLMRIVDIMLCFPSFFLVLALIAFTKPSIWNIMAVIGVTSWMGVARLVRAEVLSLKEREFILSAKSVGCSHLRIMFRHILPNALSPVWVAATLGVAGAILLESSLSFLGLGVQPPTPSWGSIITEGKDNLEVAWWITLFPGLAILLAVLGFNLLGEGLRDALDPRQIFGRQ
ncbi:ABC transporter permease [Candidatus Calescamantes bacterium]|nr:ABC transporter permease [Candidatus Calescamantes bacterium]